MNKEILLASKSPRRKDILNTLQMDFTICPSQVDESVITETDPVKLVKCLAELKADAVRNKGNDNQIILGADTIVVNGQQILGKPKSEEDVRNYLSQLSGGDHQVISAIALIDIENNTKIVRHSITNVYFKVLSDEEIEHYIASNEPFDKAGAYAIQGLGSAFVLKIEGDYHNVVGLPISLLVDMLFSLGYMYY